MARSSGAMTETVSLSRVIQELASKVASFRCSGRGRFFLGISGVPGSGKSTVSDLVCKALNSYSSPSFGPLKAVVVPMDGYHYYRRELEQMSNPEEAFRRRGAPFTFDSRRFAHDVQVLNSHKVDAEAEQFSVYFPSFDHALKDPSENAIEVPPDTDIVIFEGLYLYLDEDADGFAKVSSVLDERWFLDCELDEAMHRVAIRHIKSGICSDLPTAEDRVNQNDRPNALLVLDKCRPFADRVLSVALNQ